MVNLASSWLDIPIVARLDTNGDNFINFTDFAVLAKNWEKNA